MKKIKIVRLLSSF